MENLTGITTWESNDEKGHRRQLTDKLVNSTIPTDQLLSNIGLYIDSKTLSRLLFMDHLYKQIIDVQGCIIELGCRWGQNLALYAALRGIYEPFNRHRKIIGFDTFAGFPEVDKKDGSSDLIKLGNLATTDNYCGELDDLLSLHEALNPLSHIKKFELCKGDASVKLKEYLQREAYTIVALAYFDFDLYKPTRDCLQLLKPRLTKGSVIGFDEANDPDSPGETIAIMEVLGLPNIRLKRFPFASRVSYYVVE